MVFWKKLVFPVRRVWVKVSSRVKARQNGGGIVRLHDDVETCGYQDVKVMWEMLRRSESEVLPRPSKRRQWRRPMPCLSLK